MEEPPAPPTPPPVSAEAPVAEQQAPDAPQKDAVRCLLCNILPVVECIKTVLVTTKGNHWLSFYEIFYSFSGTWLIVL